MVVRLSRKEKVTGSIPVAAFYSIFLHAEKKKNNNNKKKKKKRRKSQQEKKDAKIPKNILNG